MKGKYLLAVILATTLALPACSMDSLASAGSASESQVSEVSEDPTGGEGVSETPPENNQAKESVSEETEETSGETVANSGQEKAQAQKNSIVIGKIVKIYGNYIEVNKAELPERMAARLEGKKSTEASATGGQTSIAPVMGGGGMPPGAGRGNGDRSTSSMDLEYSGEIIGIMIPVGSSIKSQSDDTLDLTYDSLKKGMIVRVNIDMEMTEEFQDASEEETYYADNVVVIQ